MERGEQEATAARARRPVGSVLAVVVAGAGGFWLGDWLHPMAEPAPAAPGPVAAGARPAPAPAARPVELPGPARAPAETAEAPLLADAGEAAEAVAPFRDSTGLDGPERPLLFASNTPAPFTRAVFEERFRAIAACGADAGFAVVAVDCDEFPCVGWARASSASATPFSMLDCHLDADRAFPAGHTPGQVEVPSKGRYFYWLELPPDARDREIALARLERRVAAMAARLASEP